MGQPLESPALKAPAQQATTHEYAQAMLRYDAAAQEVQFTSDCAYQACTPIYAWCGPQSNGRLLLNYGIVEETTPTTGWPSPSGCPWQIPSTP